MVCWILIPWLGIEPVPPAVEAWSLNHWTAREVPERSPFFNFSGWQPVGCPLVWSQFPHHVETGHLSVSPIRLWARWGQVVYLLSLHTSRAWCRGGSIRISWMWVTAAAAKSLQSCPTLWDPIDGSLPGSPVPGILQARTLEWVESEKWKWSRSVVSDS